MGTSSFCRTVLAVLLALTLGGQSVAQAADIWTCLVSSIVVSPSERLQGGVRLDLVRDSAERVLLVDQLRGASARATPLLRVRRDAVVRGAAAVGPDGIAWLALSTGEEVVDLYRLGDLSAPGPLEVELVAASPGLSPDSLRLGIVPVQLELGSATSHAPLLSFRDGTSNTLMLWGGRSWTILPHIEQDG